MPPLLTRNLKVKSFLAILWFLRRAGLHLMVEVRNTELHREDRDEGFHQAGLGCLGFRRPLKSLQGESAQRGQEDSQTYHHLCSFIAKFFAIASELILPTGLMRQINTIIPFRAQYYYPL